jgi:hypothetical protein
VGRQALGDIVKRLAHVAILAALVVGFALIDGGALQGLAR